MEIKQAIKSDWLQLSIVFIGIIFIGGVFLFFSSFADEDNRCNMLSADTTENISPYIPKNVNFCGEVVPINYFDVKESLEREMLINSYYHSQTILFIKKAKRFFSEVEPILKSNSVPDDFKYLMVAESGFLDIVSPMGAAGQWHFLEATAKEYGLEVNEEVDERYNLAKSTVAACRYFNESYRLYNNWTLVAASYNGGRRGVDRQMEKQGEKDYYNLLFVEETGRYVYRIIALKLIMENPEKYGFNVKKQDLYPVIPYENLKITTGIPDIGNFAREQGTSYKLIKFLNPWLRDKLLTNPQGREYTIRIPKENSRELN